MLKVDFNIRQVLCKNLVDRNINEYYQKYFKLQKNINQWRTNCLKYDKSNLQQLLFDFNNSLHYLKQKLLISLNIVNSQRFWLNSLFDLFNLNITFLLVSNYTNELNLFQSK